MHGGLMLGIQNEKYYFHLLAAVNCLSKSTRCTTTILWSTYVEVTLLYIPNVFFL